MFSDHYKFTKLFLATTLIIFLCFLASVKGNALALENDRQFNYCMENASLCENLSLSKWVNVFSCKDDRLTAKTLPSSREVENRLFFLNIPCGQFTSGDHIRILGTFTETGYFEVKRFYIDNLRNTQIQWSKYIVSILGLLFTIFFLAKNPYRSD